MLENNTTSGSLSGNTEPTETLEEVRAQLPNVDEARAAGWGVSIFRDGDTKKAPKFAVFHRKSARKRPGVFPGRNVGINSMPTSKDHHFRRSTNGVIDPIWPPHGAYDPETSFGGAPWSKIQAAAEPLDSLPPEAEKTSDEPTATGLDEDVVFSNMRSVRGMAPTQKGIVVGFDTEFFYTDTDRFIASYQFACPCVDDPRYMEQIVLVPLSIGQRLSLEGALLVVFDKAQLHEHELAPEGLTAQGVDTRSVWPLESVQAASAEVSTMFKPGTREYKREMALKRLDAIYKYRLPITLVAHFGRADMTTFRERRKGVDILRRLMSAGSGLVSERPVRVPASPDRKSHWIVPVTLNVRDTVNQSAAGSSSLAALGDVCGVPKVEISEDDISHMDVFMRDNLVEFLDYGINDSEICVEYLATLWGDNIVAPLTLSAAAAASARDMGIDYFGVRGRVERRQEKTVFYEKFAGLTPVRDGVEVYESDEKLTFYEVKHLEPISPRSSVLMNYAADSYRGGMNGCSRPGLYNHVTYDYDLQNAYPTVMSQVPDIDWEGDAILEVLDCRELTLDDFELGHMTPMFAAVTFEFPEDVRYPCIPMSVDGSMIYPRTSHGTHGVWAAGPDLYVALKLGAKIYCSIGAIARHRRVDGETSHFLGSVVKQFIQDRNTAKKTFGKKSLEELLLKTAVNSIYGKTAQNIAEHKSWSAFQQEMGEVGGSAITSPAHASMITAGIRSVLCAAMNQIEERGYHVYSYTTDGFISDAPFDLLKSLDLYGLAEPFTQARLYLTDGKDGGLWEVKHQQSDLYNITTRGNTSLSLEGVNAHNSFKPAKGVVEDSEEDRLAFRRAVVTRDGAVYNPVKKPTSFRLLSLEDRKKREDFRFKTMERNLSMDFDLKRKPILDSMVGRQETYDGTEYEVATFNTEPWETLAEAKRGREIGKLFSHKGSGPLRTVNDWHKYFLKLKTVGSGHRVHDTSRTVLMSLAIGHRQGMFTIPALTGIKRVADKCQWFTDLGLGKFSESDWKNARRPARLSQMLQHDVIADYLDVVMDIPEGEYPTHSDVERLANSVIRFDKINESMIEGENSEDGHERSA